MNKKRVKKIQYCGGGNIVTRGYGKNVDHRLEIEDPTRSTLQRLEYLSYSDEIKVTIVFAGGGEPDIFFWKRSD